MSTYLSYTPISDAHGFVSYFPFQGHITLSVHPTDGFPARSAARFPVQGKAHAVVDLN